MKPLPETFKKEERLCRQSIINQIFEAGNSYLHFPFRIAWIETPLPASFPAQTAITVSKKNFKHAVSRNRIRRQIREVYRKNKDLVYVPLIQKNKSIALVILYVAKEQLEFSEIKNGLIDALRKLGGKING